jgi:hypothetical protein
MADIPQLSWDIYQITTETTEIQGVMPRGRIRKLGLAQGFNVLCETRPIKKNVCDLLC